MKNKTIVALLFCLSGTQVSYALGQDSSKGYRISEVFILTGSGAGISSSIGIEEFKLLAPGSDFLKNNMNGLNPYGFYLNRYTPEIIAGLGIAKKGLKHSPVFRLGFNYGKGYSVDGGYYANNRYTIDTLISPNTGRKAYIDSMHYEHYNVRSSSAILQLDMSAIWRTKNKNKLTLFGGIGCSAGISLFASTEVSHSVYSYISGTTNSNYSYSYSASDATETYTNRQQTSASVYLPLGLDYRFSKKSEFWKNLHFFHESRFRIQYFSLPELMSETRAIYFSSFGLRYSIPSE